MLISCVPTHKSCLVRMKQVGKPLANHAQIKPLLCPVSWISHTDRANTVGTEEVFNAFYFARFFGSSHFLAHLWIWNSLNIYLRNNARTQRPSCPAARPRSQPVPHAPMWCFCSSVIFTGEVLVKICRPCLSLQKPGPCISRARGQSWEISCSSKTRCT